MSRAGANERMHQTTCPYCGVGCGVTIDPRNLALGATGNAEHPANYGRLCSKGSALAETLALDDRLLQPVVDGVVTDWDNALDHVAEKFRHVIEQHGPDAVAFYVSGQLLTEDYYVANKLMKGFIGSGNIDTNSRLCMSTAVVAHKRAFGADAVPGCYEDLERADLLVITGSNMAWAHPVIYQRIVAAKQARPEMRVVVIDPRRTATCELADLHLAVQPGADAFLFSGLLDYLRKEDRLDWTFIEASTEGFAQALEAARTTGGSIPDVAMRTGLRADDVATFFRWVAETPKMVTVFSQGINQSSSGVDKANAIINVHLATGRIGKEGACPFSITGQPNAMGGREVGGLANQLAAHMDFENAEAVERVSRFWGATRMAQQSGLKAVDLFEAMHAGKIKALWVMATNPAVSMPNADRVIEALDRCEFVVVSDCVRTNDTIAHADVLLPATTWGEKDGTVTNSERRISRQRAFLEAPGDAKPDWWIVTQVARRLGFADAFPYEQAVEIFREHAALSGLDNDGTRAFDIGALAELTPAAYDALEPVQWPVTHRTPDGTQRLYTEGRFFTASGKARMVAVTPRYPQNPVSEAYPLALNTGRIRDQWHTMTRTAKTPRLTAHLPEPFVQIHPVDAASWRMVDGDVATLSSDWGRMLARVQISDEQRPGSVFVPMHWNGQFASAGRVDAVVNPATDPLSGQPESKHTPVHVEKLQANWYAFLLTREELALPPGEYWVKVRGKDHWRYEMAGRDEAPADWFEWARAVLGADGEWLQFEDRAKQRFRAARVVDGKLQSALFVSGNNDLPERNWLSELMVPSELDDAERASLLAGRPGKGGKDAGRLICSCFGVGVNTIMDAIVKDGLVTVEAIGAALKAGTNCGSCVPELKKLLAQRGDQAAA